MNVETPDKRNRLLPALILVLTAVVAVQTFFLFRLIRDREEPKEMNFAEQMQLVRTPDPPPPPKAVVPIDPFAGLGGNDWDPFAEMQRMRDRMSSLFDDSFNRFRMSPGFDNQWTALSFSPQLDLQEEKDRYVVRIDIPGADKSNIEVNIDDRQLTVSGRIDQTTETKDGNMVLRQERRSGQFQRSITLPGSVKADEMKAEYKDGVLVVTVPRGEQTYRAKRVEVL